MTIATMRPIGGKPSDLPLAQVVYQHGIEKIICGTSAHSLLTLGLTTLNSSGDLYPGAH
jgi:hypothetical protein